MQSETGSSPVQAVIFDLDGVLMNSEWLAYKVWQEYAAMQGGKLPDSDYAGTVGISLEDTAAYVMTKAAVNFDVREGCEWVRQRIIEQMAASIEPLPGAVDLVRSIAERGYPLAIASNSMGSYIERALTGLGLLAYFPIRVGIDQVAQGKPAPDVYRCAAEKMNMLPENCLAIEDSRVGVQSAASAGMRVIAVPDAHDHAGGFPQAWRVYPTLLQVRENLDEVFGNS